MNGTQVVITVLYGLLLVPCAVGLVLLVRSTRRPTDTLDEPRLAHGEVVWGWVAGAILAVVLGLTIWQVPYFSDADAADQVVQVGAQQYAWAVKPNTVKAGTPVEFRLTSRDVQHGFGVYRGTTLLFQVQVPADAEQRRTYTFDKPGRYDILCLEYCGFQHHLMRGAITVR